MVLTLEEPQEVSRRNGAKGKGPLSPETKSICSRNALKGGLFARVHNLLDECPLEIAELREKWYADEKPQTASERLSSSKSAIAAISRPSATTGPWSNNRNT